MVVILKLGCINGSYLDSEQISEFLNISVEEVIDITKKVLQDLKENIDGIICLNSEESIHIKKM